MIQAKVIADSIAEPGNRITTMVVTMPRIILAEFNTHRMFSRNSASSRAIPFEKMVKSVVDNPFIPIAWQKDHKGMQGTEYFPQEGFTAEEGIGGVALVGYWLNARNKAIQVAESLSHSNLTKQLCNRLLEPFMYHTVLVTATEWENFFALRCPQYKFNNEIKGRSRKDILKQVKDLYTSTGVPDAIFNDLSAESNLFWLGINEGQAEIHMMALAEAMWDALNESTPKELKAGEWHIPFGDDIDGDYLIESIIKPRGIPEDFHNYDSGMKHLKKEIRNEFAIKIATARCARVSYTVIGEEDKPANYENDIKLHDRLAVSGHWSPFEHCAQAMTEEEYYLHSSGQDGQASHVHGFSGNFRGFIQYRKTFAHENITKE